MVDMVRTTALHTVRRHRWILVVPFVLSMVFFTVRDGHMRLAAQASNSDSWSTEKLHADEGTRYTVAHDGSLVVEVGGLLVDAAGLTMVRAGDWTVSVWGGGMYVSLQPDRLTVAALDVPVVVRGSRGIVVIPPMRQWTDTKGIVPDPAVDPVAWMEEITMRPLPPIFALERLTAVHALRAARGGVSVLQELDGTDAHSVALYALSARQTRVLAGMMRLHADLRTYALLHPAVRDAAWAYLPDEVITDTEGWVALLSLPTLISPETSASPLLARRWGETMQKAFTSSPQSDDVISALLPVLETRIVDVAAAGFPLRALHFAHALHAAVGTGSVLTDTAQASLKRLGAMTPDSLRASVLADAATPMTVPVRKSAPSIIHIEADPTLEQRARDRLVARGAMFTKDSSITTVAPGTVDVRGVIFGLPTGDRALRFIYVMESDTVRAVVDGAIQPYEVSFEAYMAWERSR